MISSKALSARGIQDLVSAMPYPHLKRKLNRLFPDAGFKLKEDFDNSGRKRKKRSVLDLWGLERRVKSGCIRIRASCLIDPAQIAQCIALVKPCY
jgi:hypothetical protein